MNVDSAEYNYRERLCWYLMLCLSIVPLVLAVIKGLEFTNLQFMSLAVIFTISTIVNKYRFTIPGTQTNISAKELIIFWGIIWLGVHGGVLLAVSVSLAKLNRVSYIRRDKWLFDFFVNVFGAFIAGTTFYFTLKYLTGFSENAVAQNRLSPGSIILAAVIMATTYFWITSLILTTYLKATGRFSFRELWKQNFFFTAGTYVLSTAFVLLIQIIFYEFGLKLSLIALPVVVGAHLVYRFFMRKLAQKTKEIGEASRIHLATVEALATAIDARDQIGVGHIRRTQSYAVGLGELLMLSPEKIQALNTGALLHGIGKLAVPDNILNKPGRLTPAELEKTKIHPVVGASIIEAIKFPYPVEPTIKYFTEMWSGNGYPEGLRGDEIPLTARILAVADAYDTLRAERPYRPAISRDQARRILQNRSGSQFDPAIVDVFLRNLSHLESKVKEKGLYYESEANPELIHDGAIDENYVNQIKRANREVFTLYELARVFSSTLNLEETFALFAEKIRQQVPFDTCVVYLIDDSATVAQAIYAEGKNSDELKDKCIRIGEGATGYVLENREPVCHLDPALDFSFDKTELVEQYSAMASLPLFVDEKLLGAVSLYSGELEQYGEEDLRLIQMVSQIASDAIAIGLKHAESESLALTDDMTGLPNARSLQIQFEKEVARANRNGSNFQVLMLDLDGFKAVNDTFGHNAGDRMLKELAKVMKSQLRDYDFLARYAGDEFVIIVPESNSSAVDELRERLEKAVAEYKLPVEEGIYAAVGVSLGSSCYPTDGESIDQIIISADKRMYSVKAERKLRQNLPDLPLALRPKSKAAPKKIEENTIVELDESHIISNAIN